MIIAFPRGQQDSTSSGAVALRAGLRADMIGPRQHGGPSSMAGFALRHVLPPGRPYIASIPPRKPGVWVGREGAGVTV